MRLTRAEAVTIGVSLTVFLGPLLWPRPALPGRPEPGMSVARRLLQDLVARQDIERRHETFVYGQTPEEPAYYSYAVFARDLKGGLYDLDVQIRWKAIPETSTQKGSRPMEVHLGQLVKKKPI